MSSNEKKQPIKKPYSKPKIKSETMQIYGALCNGSTSGGRKQTTGAPSFCNATKLLS